MNYFFSGCIGFLLGIALSAYILSDTVLFFCLVLSIIVFFHARLFERGSVRSVGFLISILFFGIFLGQFRVLAFDHGVLYDLGKYESQVVNIRAEIISDPVGNGITQKFTANVSTITLDTASSTAVTGLVSVTTDLYPAYHYGDVISIYGTLQPPQEVVQDDIKIFNYPAYLLKDGITETMVKASVKWTGKNTGNFLIKFLYGIRNSFVRSMQRVLPEPEAGLMAGIVLGTQTLSNDLNTQFRTAGLSHVVVLSGYNITIVAESALALALYLTPVYASFIAVLSVVLFVLMSGAGASSLRAGIMAIVALLGKRFGKTYNAGRALFFAAFIMIVWNPETLLYDPSFHLSFLATIAMVYVSPIVLEKFAWITEKYGLREMLGTTISAQFYVLPYILYMSGKIQLLALPSNMLVLPFVPLTMLLGLLVGVFGFVSRFIGLIPGIPSYLVLSYDIFIVQSISKLLFAQVSINNFPLYMMLTFYLITGIYLYKRNKIIS